MKQYILILLHCIQLTLAGSSDSDYSEYSYSEESCDSGTSCSCDSSYYSDSEYCDCCEEDSDFELEGYSTDPAAQ